MSFATEVETLEVAVKDLVKMIRKISEEQIDLWQQIPYLALQADGRTGYSDNYARAYHYGYWAIQSSVNSGYYTVYVCLENGVLVNPRKGTKPDFPASDEDVLRIAMHMAELNASRIIKDLKAQALTPIPSYYKDKDRTERDERIADVLKNNPIVIQSHQRFQKQVR